MNTPKPYSRNAHTCHRSYTAPQCRVFSALPNLEFTCPREANLNFTTARAGRSAVQRGERGGEGGREEGEAHEPDIPGAVHQASGSEERWDFEIT